MPKLPIFNVKLTHPQAVFPTKAHETDVGYDLTIIAKDTKISEMTTMYETGVCIFPAEDLSYNTDVTKFYIEIVPRSSLVKSGYILTNSVGIIDPDYQGTLKVVLTKIDPSMPDLTLPFKGVQILVRQVYDGTTFQQVPDTGRNRMMMPQTSRGEGGFGSTDQLIEPLTRGSDILVQTSSRKNRNNAT